MPSANGYKLSVCGVELVASWPAPFYCLVLPEADDDLPMLIHCDSYDHACRHRPGIILDAGFNEVR